MFKPRGDRAHWRTVYERISLLRVEDQVTDVELASMLPDSAAETSWRSAFHRAVKELEQTHKRTFARVRGVGYRMVEAAEHEGLARAQHKRAKGRLAAAYSKAHSADRSRLKPDERQRLDAIELNLAQQQALTKRLETRVERLHQGLQEARREHREDIASVSDRVDKLAEQLDRAGLGSMPNA